jgi:DNA-binding response OmpR family regulator
VSRPPAGPADVPAEGAGAADTIACMTAHVSGNSAGAQSGATVLVYSNSADLRAQVRTAVGRRPAPDVGRIDWVECATNAEVVAQLDEGGLDVVILDGEAQPTGGMGLARQFKYEIADCPPIVVLIARRQDGWLASWSLADAVMHMPLDPIEAADVVAEQLRRRTRGIPVVR